MAPASLVEVLSVERQVKAQVATDHCWLAGSAASALESEASLHTSQMAARDEDIADDIR